MGKFKDLIGRKFGKLLVLHKTMKNNRIYYNCLCDCGNILDIRNDSLLAGKDNCGCLTVYRIKKANTKHNNSTHKLYPIWVSMMSRCNKPNNKAYANYGGRGIKVCHRWYNILNFIEDMGERPDGFSLDRINNDGNYEPSNCRWADSKTQNNNRRDNVKIVIDDVEYSINELAEITGLHYKQIWYICK